MQAAAAVSSVLPAASLAVGAVDSDRKLLRPLLSTVPRFATFRRTAAPAAVVVASLFLPVRDSLGGVDDFGDGAEKDAADGDAVSGMSSATTSSSPFPAVDVVAVACASATATNGSSAATSSLAAIMDEVPRYLHTRLFPESDAASC